MPQLSKSNRKVSPFLWHALAGAFASLSLPPLFLLPAIFALSVPLLGYLHAQSRHEAAMIFGAAGLGWFLASTYWVSNSLIVESLSNWFLMPLMALVLAFILAIFWAVSAFCSWSFGRCPTARLLWILAFFSLSEWGRGFIATGFPWNLTGSIFAVDLASLQAASTIGIYGLCVIAMTFAAVPAFWAIGCRSFSVVCLLLPLLMAMGGAKRLSNDFLSETLLSAGPLVRLVQPAIPQAEKWDHTKRQDHLNRLIKLSKGDGGAPKLIIWPETAFAGFPNRNAELLERTVRKATTSQGTLITGMPRLGNGRTLLNSAVMIDHEGKTKGVYDKEHLVPFGEYMPFRKWLPFFNPIVGKLDFVPGQNNVLMRQEGIGTMQLLICYEVIFSGNVITSTTRPDLMVNLSNDAWFGASAGPWQHLVQAQMRAVEEGVPLFRVANTGITAGFDSYGRVLGSIPIGAKGVLDLAVPASIAQTIFARFGNLGFFCLLILIAAVAAWLDLRRPIRQ